jgi:hypothetical protein
MSLLFLSDVATATTNGNSTTRATSTSSPYVATRTIVALGPLRLTLMTHAPHLHGVCQAHSVTRLDG